MKKLIILSILIMLTGCGLIKEEPIEQALKDLADAKNYTIEINGEVTTEDGVETMTGTLATDLENERSYVKMQMETSGFSIESYTINEDDKTITYAKTPFFNSFIKSISDKEDFKDDLVPDFTNKTENLEYTKIDTKDGVITYEVIFNDLKLTDLDEEEKTYEEITIIFKVKNNQIISYSVKSTDEAIVQTMEFIVLNINQTEIIIPQEIINSAVDEEEVRLEIFKDIEFELEQ